MTMMHTVTVLEIVDQDCQNIFLLFKINMSEQHGFVQACQIMSRQSPIVRCYFKLSSNVLCLSYR